MERRDFLRNAIGAAAATMAGARLLGAQQGTTKAAAAKSAAQALPAMTVYKSASCGCCKGWVAHMQKAGFTVNAVDTNDLAGVKKELGVPANLQSCHTGVIGAYLVEGHVPAADVKRLLATKPKVKGLAVPGMPVGSPGMEQGSPADYDKYEVLTFAVDGKTTVFVKH